MTDGIETSGRKGDSPGMIGTDYKRPTSRIEPDKVKR